MGKEGRSFFERLTGTVNVDDFEEEVEEEIDMMQDEDRLARQRRDTLRIDQPAPQPREAQHMAVQMDEPEEPMEVEMETSSDDWIEEESEEGQLTVDVFNTPNEIVVKAIVAGVKPDDLDISITRDMVTIRGKREAGETVEQEDYFYRELYWGAFSRTILLPQEIEVEAAQATEKHGLLSIKLPKVDKEKQTKLKVKAG